MQHDSAPDYQVVLIDNKDSFVFNLARYFNELGHNTQVVRHDKVNVEDIAALKPTHIVISPGPCGPEQAGVSIQVVEHFNGVCPILGVCLGHQVIGHAFGGQVIRAPSVAHGKQDQVFHQATGLFAGLSTPLSVARYHSLVVDVEGFPDCLDITATHSNGMIMALAHKRTPTFGVQFHPESLLTEDGPRLLQNFLNQGS